MERFNAELFLREHFRDIDGVERLTRKHLGASPQRDAIRKWFERASIPATWLSRLILVVELEYGAPVSMGKFMGGENNAASIFT